MTVRFLRAAPMVVVLIGISALLVHSMVTPREDVVAERVRASEPWVAHIETMDGAIQQGRIGGAVRAWHDAHLAAIGSRRWEGMVATGDAYLRIGVAAPGARAFRAQARQSYLVGLDRARAAESVVGVLRVARAFEALGDDEVVAMCIRIATDIATRSPDAADHALVRRFMEPVTLAGGLRTP